MSQESPAFDSKRLPWVVPPAFLPFWMAAIEWGWWRVFQDEGLSAGALAAAGLPSPTLVVAVATTGKLLGHVSEAAFYVLLWRARGTRLPFRRFFVWVVSASIADQFAFGLAAPYRSGGAPLWRVCLAGLHLATGTVFHESPVIRAGFGSLGLLTATRIAVTGAAQAQATGRSLAEGVGWTLLVWLVTRLAAMGGLDLLRGMSPLGG